MGNVMRAAYPEAEIRAILDLCSKSALL